MFLSGVFCHFDATYQILLIRTLVRHPFYICICICFVIVISVTSSVCYFFLSISLQPFYGLGVGGELGSNEITTMFIMLFWWCCCEQSELAFWEYVLQHSFFFLHISFLTWLIHSRINDCVNRHQSNIKKMLAWANDNFFFRHHFI